MKISNSQIMAFQKCPKRFYFEHVLDLKPKEYPIPMMKGTHGHTMMEAFFTCMLHGPVIDVVKIGEEYWPTYRNTPGTYEECVAAINPFLEDLLKNDPNATEFMSVYRHVLAFGAFYFAKPWKPVEIENSLAYEVDEDLEFVFTPDLISEWTMGPHKGKRFALDYKFTGQYWSKREVDMMQQLPKYALYYNLLNEQKVSQCGIVMLNTRAAAAATGTGLFKLEWVPLTKKKLETLRIENEKLMYQVAYAKSSFAPSDFVRTTDPHQCKLCVFADDLCPADLEGRDTKRMIERNYELNTYFKDNYETEPKEISQ